MLGSVCVSQKAATPIQRCDLAFVTRNEAAGQAELDQFIAQSGNTERRTETSADAVGAAESRSFAKRTNPAQTLAGRDSI